MVKSSQTLPWLPLCAFTKRQQLCYIVRLLILCSNVICTIFSRVCTDVVGSYYEGSVRAAGQIPAYVMTTMTTQRLHNDYTAAYLVLQEVLRSSLLCFQRCSSLPPTPAPTLLGAAPACFGVAPACFGTAPALSDTAPACFGEAPALSGTAPACFGVAPGLGAKAPGGFATAPV